jgi:hypothetical protein
MDGLASLSGAAVVLWMSDLGEQLIEGTGRVGVVFQPFINTLARVQHRGVVPASERRADLVQGGIGELP